MSRVYAARPRLKVPRQAWNRGPGLLGHCRLGSCLQPGVYSPHSCHAPLCRRGCQGQRAYCHVMTRQLPSYHDLNIRGLECSASQGGAGVLMLHAESQLSCRCALALLQIPMYLKQNVSCSEVVEVHTMRGRVVPVARAVCLAENADMLTLDLPEVAAFAQMYHKEELLTHMFEHTSLPQRCQHGDARSWCSSTANCVATCHLSRAFNSAQAADAATENGP
jgi:hypothetical protein